MYTVDIDVVVLAELVAATLPAGMEVWLAFGVGKHFQSLAAHQAPACLESEKSFTHITFHTLTGCDTMPAFIGPGNNTGQAAWNSFPEFTTKIVLHWR